MLNREDRMTEITGIYTTVMIDWDKIKRSLREIGEDYLDDYPEDDLLWEDFDDYYDDDWGYGK
jgi:hypothetical protein